MFEESGYTPSQRAMVELWEERTAPEFGDRPTEKTLAQDLMEHPFSGGASIGTGAFDLVLDRFQTSTLSDLR